MHKTKVLIFPTGARHILCAHICRRYQRSTVELGSHQINKGLVSMLLNVFRRIAKTRRMILLIITTVTIMTMTNMTTRSPPILSLAGPISSYSDSARDTGRLPAWGESLQIYSYLQIDIRKEIVYFSIFLVFLITPLKVLDFIYCSMFNH